LALESVIDVSLVLRRLHRVTAWLVSTLGLGSHVHPVA
jgi:hypothetical protein